MGVGLGATPAEDDPAMIGWNAPKPALAATATGRDYFWSVWLCKIRV